MNRFKLFTQQVFQLLFMTTSKIYKRIAVKFWDKILEKIKKMTKFPTETHDCVETYSKIEAVYFAEDNRWPIPRWFNKLTFVLILPR